MGNSLSPCFNPNTNHLVKLVFWGGTTRFLTQKHLAGELMYQFPGQIVCHSDSFYIGHPPPVLSIDDELITGETYFVLPVDRFRCTTLSAASLASLTSGPKRSPVNLGQCPFEVIKSTDGKTLIKVLPEIITRIISGDSERRQCGDVSQSLISTPELQKHYAQLVGSRERHWSPKLATISEHKSRSWPCRLLGLGWR